MSGAPDDLDDLTESGFGVKIDFYPQTLLPETELWKQTPPRSCSVVTCVGVGVCAVYLPPRPVLPGSLGESRLQQRLPERLWGSTSRPSVEEKESFN